MDDTFDPDLIHAIFKLVWSRRSEKIETNDDIEVIDLEPTCHPPRTFGESDNPSPYQIRPVILTGEWRARGSRSMWAWALMEDNGNYRQKFQLVYTGNQSQPLKVLGQGLATTLAGAGTSKKSRPTTANLNGLKVSCELLRLFVTEAVQRASVIADAEGLNKIEATHLERILPQLLLDF